MARLQSKSPAAPDEARRTPYGRVDIYTLDDLVIGRTEFEPGWHWVEHVQPLAGTRLCQYHHVGVCLRGRRIKTTGDGVLALFDGSERAVRAAAAICLAAKSLGLAIRAGVHTGEVELVAGDVRGMAVHVAARIMALAGPSPGYVSATPPA